MSRTTTAAIACVLMMSSIALAYAQTRPTPLINSPQEPAPLTDAQLSAWFAEAQQAAAKVPADQRRSAAGALKRSHGRDGGIKAALLQIALRPQHIGVFNAVMAAGEFPEGAIVLSPAYLNKQRETVISFVERLYRSHAGTQSEEARNWQGGLVELMLYTGRFDEALALARPLAASEPDDAYSQTMAAVLEKVGGNSAPLKKVIENCPPRPKETAEGHSPEEYCAAVALSLARRAADALYDKTPKVLQELAAGNFGQQPDWQSRIMEIRTFRDTDPQRAEKAAMAILGDANAPDEAKSDAAYGMGMMATLRNDRARAFSYFECWLALRHVKFPPLGKDAWDKLRDVEEDRAVSGDPSCSAFASGPDEPLNSACVSAVLAYQLVASSDRAVKRMVMTRLASVALTTGKSAKLLASSMNTYALGSSDPKEKEAVLRYASGLKVQAEDSETMVAHRDRILRAAPSRALEPWPLPDPATYSVPRADCK